MAWEQRQYFTGGSEGEWRMQWFNPDTGETAEITGDNWQAGPVDPAKVISSEEDFMRRFPNAIYNQGNRTMNYLAPQGSGTEYFTDYLNNLMQKGTPVYRSPYDMPGAGGVFNGDQPVYGEHQGIAFEQYPGWEQVTQPFERRTHGHGGISGFMGNTVAPLIKPAIAVGTAILGGMAAAPYLGAGAAGTTAGAGAGTAAGVEGAASGAGLGATAGGAGGATAGASGAAAGGGLGALAGGAAGGIASQALSGSAAGDVATGAGAGGSAGGAAGGVAAGTALSRIFSNTGTAADYLSVLGNLGVAGLGVYGANKQANSLEDLANQYMAMGAPSRARYEGSFAPGFSMEMDPGYTDALNQAAKSTLHGMSAKFGNPADSPNAWAATLSDLYKGTAYPALQDYRRLGANAGGLSRFAEAAPGAATGAISADAGKLNAIGAGAANIFNPPSTLEQILRGMRYA